MASSTKKPEIIPKKIQETKTNVEVPKPENRMIDANARRVKIDVNPGT